jgi:HEAT repeat protein
MCYRNSTWMVLAAALWVCGAAMANAEDAPAANAPVASAPTLDSAFQTLTTYDWGDDRDALNPIDDAVNATHGNAAARKELETRLAAVLKTKVSRDAKDYVCRQLMVIGTAASVPALAELLPDKDHSHMARYALERMPAPEAAQALRDALPKLNGALKVGVISSLGARRDAASVSLLAALLGDADRAVVAASLCALGDIGNSESAKALGAYAKQAPDATKAAVADALLVCAERLLNDGKKMESLAIYKSLAGESQPKQIRMAATRGILVASGKKD